MECVAHLKVDAIRANRKVRIIQVNEVTYLSVPLRCWKKVLYHQQNILISLIYRSISANLKLEIISYISIYISLYRQYH